MIKYRIEYLVATPWLFVLFAYYLSMALDNDSAVQKPEKLYKEKRLMLLVLIFVVIVLLCSFVDMEFLHKLTSNALIHVEV